MPGIEQTVDVVVIGSAGEEVSPGWFRLPAPDGLAEDLSTQMAFRYLDSGATLHGNAEVVER